MHGYAKFSLNPFNSFAINKLELFLFKRLSNIVSLFHETYFVLIFFSFLERTSRISFAVTKGGSFQ